MVKKGYNPVLPILQRSLANELFKDGLHAVDALARHWHTGRRQLRLAGTASVQSVVTHHNYAWQSVVTHHKHTSIHVLLQTTSETISRCTPQNAVVRNWTLQTVNIHHPSIYYQSTCTVGVTAELGSMK